VVFDKERKKEEKKKKSQASSHVHGNMRTHQLQPNACGLFLLKQSALVAKFLPSATSQPERTFLFTFIIFSRLLVYLFHFILSDSCVVCLM
jgi:hypothetical protein